MFQDPVYLTLQILIFLAVFFQVAAFVLSFSGLRSWYSRRISRHLPGKFTGSQPKKDMLKQDSAGPAARIFYRFYQVVVSPDEAREKKTRLKLIRAGFRSQRAYQNYAASKMALGLFLPVFLWLWLLYSTLTIILGLLFCLGLGLAGFFIPDIVLLQLAQKRQERILKATPDALDLMVICVEAGLGLDMAMKKVGDEIRSLSKDLSEEFYLTSLEINVGKRREDSLKSLGERTGVAEVRNLMVLLIQTNRFGTSLGQVLRVHSDAMRAKRRQKAQERAAKAAIKLLIPLIFFIFPALFVVILGPAWIRIAENLLQVGGG
jgi:tight adherence protein C